MPQKAPGKKLNNEIEPNPELINRVYEYIKAQQPCRVCDVIDAMRRFFYEDLTRDEVKLFVIKALAILTNKEKRVFVECTPLVRELSFVFLVNN